MKIAFQHASGESVRSVLVLFIFGAANGGVYFFEMHLMGKGEEQMARLYLMADKVYPVPVGAFLDQKEKIIVLPVRQVKMGAMAYGGVVDLPDLKKVVSVFGGLTKRIMRDALFLPEIVQLR